MSASRNRLEMSATVIERRPAVLPGARRPVADDLHALAALMLDAYQGTVDYTGESLADAQAEMAKTFAGGYGVFHPGFSWVVERGSALVCAALVTRVDEAPLLAFAMTAPRWQRQGLAGAAIEWVMHDLFRAGERRLDLVVNGRNHGAIELYSSLGFGPKESADRV